MFFVQLLFLFVDMANEELSRPTLTLYGLDTNEPVVSINIIVGHTFILQLFQFKFEHLNFVPGHSL